MNLIEARKRLELLAADCRDQKFPAWTGRELDSDAEAIAVVLAELDRLAADVLPREKLLDLTAEALDQFLLCGKCSTPQRTPWTCREDPGEANKYIVLDGPHHWVMAIQMNGELSLNEQRRIMRVVTAGEALFDVLLEALPYVEMAQQDPAYKKGAVGKMVRKMREVIAQAEKETPCISS